MIFRSPNNSAPARNRATSSCVLPFCLGADRATRRDNHIPPCRSPRAASKTSSCHASNGYPSAADKSAASSQELATDPSGTTFTLGGACCPIGTSISEFVNRITHLIFARNLLDLVNRGTILTSQRPPLVRVSIH